MKKHEAIDMLGGSVAMAAEAIGIKSQAISQWPEELPARLTDRVQAALWRMNKATPMREPAPVGEAAHE